jgi:cellulose synthase/poly-beta-1,6-N-acetylglucosamine synthase-like glycosyltransferase
MFLIASVTVGSVELNAQKRRNMTFNYLQSDYYIPISVIVPAYNEELTVIDTVNSLLGQNYRLYEIIVVNDGSKDNTAQVLIDRFDLQKVNKPIRKKIQCSSEDAVYVSYDYKVPITLITKKNGGKADSLNLGISAAEYPYVICIDADSMLQHDALEKIARCAMESDETIAVGGLVRIVNDVVVDEGKVVDYKLPKKLILCMQVFEYDRSFLASRLLFDKFNGNLIISGAFGLFRKDILIEMGGYNINTIGEDMEVIVRMHAVARANNIPYNIRYTSDAVCWTQVPKSLKDLATQRRRWHIGLLESIKNHRTILFNPSYGLLSFISFTYFLVYELLSPFIELFGVASIIVAMFFKLINVPYMLMFFGIYVVFNSIISLTAFFSRVYAMNVRLKKIDIVKAIFISLFENIGLRTILVYVRFSALLGKRKKQPEWGVIERMEHNKKSTNQGEVKKETSSEKDIA